MWHHVVGMGWHHHLARGRVKLLGWHRRRAGIAGLKRGAGSERETWSHGFVGEVLSGQVADKSWVVLSVEVPY